MSTTLEAMVDHAKTLDCIGCGLCQHTCPTYRLTGVESASPRGRIRLMRAVAEDHLVPDASLQEELDACLVCRNCESVCPSGVEFGAMMGETRGRLAETMPMGFGKRVARHIGFRWVLTSRFALSVTATLMRFASLTRLNRVAASLLGKNGEALRNMPHVPPRSERRRLPAVSPATGERITSVGVLEGCVMPELLGRVNRSTVRVLNAAGIETRTAAHVCCGSLHAHNGDLEGARRLAKQSIEAYEALRDDAGNPVEVVVNSAGCGSHMKEYAHLFEPGTEWHKRATAFSKRVFDFSEILAREAHASRLRGALSKPATLSEPLAFDDPCHLCHGQGVRSEPREVIDLVPGAKRVEIEDSESCCGSAGIYSMLRPTASRGILEPRLDAIADSGARTLVTSNPGCHLQWQLGLSERGADTEVLHLAELLDRSLK